MVTVVLPARGLPIKSAQLSGRYQLAGLFRGRLFDLDDEGFALLEVACSGHTDGRTDGDITVQTCWDADRLDLGRVGITPHRAYLCTDHARTEAMIRWADGRACLGFVPEIVGSEWKLAEVCQPRRRGWIR